MFKIKVIFYTHLNNLGELLNRRRIKDISHKEKNMPQDEKNCKYLKNIIRIIKKFH